MLEALNPKLGENDLYTEARKAYILGDLVKAKTLLDESYAEGIIQVKRIATNGNEYEAEFEALINKYTKVYAKMGMLMPDLSKFNKINSIPG